MQQGAGAGRCGTAVATGRWRVTASSHTPACWRPRNAHGGVAAARVPLLQAWHSCDGEPRAHARTTHTASSPHVSLLPRRTAVRRAFHAGGRCVRVASATSAGAPSDALAAVQAVQKFALNQFLPLGTRRPSCQQVSYGPPPSRVADGHALVCSSRLTPHRARGWCLCMLVCSAREPPWLTPPIAKLGFGWEVLSVSEWPRAWLI
jgi:hypothetical protein